METHPKDHETFINLPCVLTDSERVEISSMAADWDAEANSMEESLKEHQKSVKEQINALRKDCSINLAILRDGKDYRDVKCVVKMHQPENGKKTIIRTDTNATVSVEKMTEDEIQEELQFA